MPCAEQVQDFAVTLLFWVQRRTSFQWIYVLSSNLQERCSTMEIHAMIYQRNDLFWARRSIVEFASLCRESKLSNRASNSAGYSVACDRYWGETIRCFITDRGLAWGFGPTSLTFSRYDSYRQPTYGRSEQRSGKWTSGGECRYT